MPLSSKSNRAASTSEELRPESSTIYPRACLIKAKKSYKGLSPGSRFPSTNAARSALRDAFNGHEFCSHASPRDPCDDSVSDGETLTAGKGAHEKLGYDSASLSHSSNSLLFSLG
jgi:hypothetical protein